MRPGWGERHPELAGLLERRRPAATLDTAWANGTVPLRISSYPEVAPVPEQLVVSVRCLVRVDELLVVCTNTDGRRHPWPGGRRESGETFEDTACREVLEETGWILQRESLRPLGWLHLEDLTPREEDWPFPHPDFLQLVYAGRAADRAVDRGADWSDTQGYEISSTLMTLQDAWDATEADPLARGFIDLLR